MKFVQRNSSLPTNIKKCNIPLETSDQLEEYLLPWLLKNLCRAQIKLNEAQVIQAAFTSPGFLDRSALFHKRTVFLH